MYSPIVSEEKIASHESTSTFEAFEWTFLGICGEMSAWATEMAEGQNESTWDPKIREANMANMN